jgi:flavorubredoxin
MWKNTGKNNAGRDLIPMKKIMIIYHSQQYGNTRKMADLVEEGCKQVAGVEVQMVNTNEQRVDMKVFAACDGVALGSADCFSYVGGGLKQFFDDAWIAKRAGLSTGGKPYVGFLSHGGGGKAIASLEKLAQSMQYTQATKSVLSQGAPSGATAEECRALGKALAEQVNK